jgi:protein SCO1/2
MSRAKRGLLAVSLVAVASAAVVAGVHMAGPSHHVHEHAPLEALERTYLRIAGSAPLSAASLQRTDGSAFPAHGLEGRWTLLFFGFTSCPDVCPTTLQALSTVARDPASGVAAGSTAIVFVSTDPENDTAQRMRTYLESFDARIVGCGRPRRRAPFRRCRWRRVRRGEGHMDHLTSIFVLDPEARVRRSAPALVGPPASWRTSPSCNASMSSRTLLALTRAARSSARPCW